MISSEIRYYPGCLLLLSQSVIVIRQKVVFGCLKSSSFDDSSDCIANR